MSARRALLKKIAAVADWDHAKRAPLDGDAWIESRNTMYRFKDGACVDVACRDPKKNDRARVIVGMQLVAWLVKEGDKLRLSYAWARGACAVLWRPDSRASNGGEEAMAMTSPTTAFTRGASPACLQALHDAAPPYDSATFPTAKKSRFLDHPRPKLPSQSTQSRS